MHDNNISTLNWTIAAPIAAAIVFAMFMAAKLTSGEDAVQTPDRHVYSRQELHYSLLGRPMQEVRQMLGVPSKVDEGLSHGTESWYYMNPPTWNEKESRMDWAMMVRFVDGRVYRLYF